MRPPESRFGFQNEDSTIHLGILGESSYAEVEVAKGDGNAYR